MSSSLFRWSTRELLAATTVTAIATAVAIYHPAVAFFSFAVLLLLALHFPELFMRFFPRTTLLCFSALSVICFIAAIYDAAMNRTVDHGVLAKAFAGVCMAFVVWMGRRTAQEGKSPSLRERR